MRPPRGHRAVEHTADEILEAWGPTRAVCLKEAVEGFVGLFADTTGARPTRAHELVLEGEDATVLLDLLDEVIWLLDVRGAVPRSVAVADHGARVAVRMGLVDVDATTPTGPPPKGVSLSGLALHPDDHGAWQARALVDI